MPEMGDYLFGKIVLTMNKASELTLEKCLQIQRRLHSEGKKVHLGQVMVNEGILSKEDVREILNMQNIEIMVCPKCGKTFNAFHYDKTNPYTCEKCERTLEVLPFNKWTLSFTEEIGKDMLKYPMPLSEQEMEPIEELPFEKIFPELADLDAVIEHLRSTRGEFRRYAIEKPISSGPNWMMYSCMDKVTKRKLAIKLFTQEMSTSEPVFRQLLKVITIFSKLEHRCILPIYDIGIATNNHLYYTMRLVSGESLSDVFTRLKARNLRYQRLYALHRLLHIFQEVCSCLSYVNANNIVHSNICPDSIIVGFYGEVFVINWEGAILRSQDTDNQTVIPLEGQDVKIGNPAYMSPEKVNEEIKLIDEKSDIYSLGALLFSMLCLEPPGFISSQDEMNVLTPKQELIYFRKDKGVTVSERLMTIVEKAMQPKRGNRQEIIRDLFDAIERYCESTTGRTNAEGGFSKFFRKLKGK